MDSYNLVTDHPSTTDCGDGILRASKNGLWYHGMIPEEKDYAKKGMGQQGVPCFFKYKTGKKLPRPKWDTHDPQSFCSNCIIDDEANKSRKVVFVYRCMGHRIEQSEVPALEDRKPEVPALEDRKPEVPALEDRKPEAPALEDRKPEAPALEDRKPSSTIPSIIEDLQELIDNLKLSVNSQDTQTPLTPIENEKDHPVPMEIDTPLDECSSPPRKRMKTFHPIHN